MKRLLLMLALIPKINSKTLGKSKMGLMDSFSFQASPIFYLLEHLNL